jgi:transposase
MAASKQERSKQGSGHQHPRELRERAVRMVEETIKETGERHGVVTRIAVQLGLGSETLRHWVKQAEINNGRRPGITTRDQQRIAELEKENRELRRANEILKAASAFFARELDPRLPK